MLTHKKEYYEQQKLVKLMPDPQKLNPCKVAAYWNLSTKEEHQRSPNNIGPHWPHVLCSTEESIIQLKQSTVLVCLFLTVSHINQ